MKKINLKAEPRTIQGRKVKKLRRQQILPASLYGKKITSRSIQVKAVEFNHVFGQVGETKIIELALGKDRLPVLIKNVQIDPLTEAVLHVDFYQVDLKEKVKANVPIELVGVAPAVTEKVGVLLELIDEVEVEALPADLPASIKVDISQLVKVNDAVKIGQVSISGEVTINADKDQEIVRIGELVKKEVQVEPEIEVSEGKEEVGAETGADEGKVGQSKPEVVTKPDQESKSDNQVSKETK